MRKLVLENIKKSFGSKMVLSDVNFRFEQGKIYGLIGRNGAGKTTLFNCLSSEIKADGGSFYLQEAQPDGSLSDRALQDNDIGYVLSSPFLPDFLTGREFVQFLIEINKSDRDADYFLEMVALEHDDRDRLIKGYSHGMKNKLQMLIFLIARPPVVLLDEPLTNFDVLAALEIKRLIRSLRSDHIIVFSTHILQLATDICDELVILNDGKLTQIDHEMLKSPDFEQQIADMLRDKEEPHA